VYRYKGMGLCLDKACGSAHISTCRALFSKKV